MTSTPFQLRQILPGQIKAGIGQRDRLLQDRTRFGVLAGLDQGPAQIIQQDRVVGFESHCATGGVHRFDPLAAPGQTVTDAGPIRRHAGMTVGGLLIQLPGMVNVTGIQQQRGGFLDDLREVRFLCRQGGQRQKHLHRGIVPAKLVFE